MSDGMHCIVLAVQAQFDECLLYEVLDVAYAEGLPAPCPLNRYCFGL